MNNLEVITYHGWAFDSGCWKEWVRQLPDATLWHHYDRGYFGEPSIPAFTAEGGTRIVMTHSFGFHFCPDEIFRQADFILVFAGFLAFHPRAAQFRRRSRQVVAEMIRQFDSQPQKVLNVFYRNVFHPKKAYELPGGEFDKALLLQDLCGLDRNERSLPPYKEEARIFIFHGSDDAIVPKSKGRGLYEKFGSPARYFEIKQCGHALPLTRARKCWHLIKPQIIEQAVGH